ncbi:MAG: polymerase III subunit delta, DNA polymerase III subunit delta protein [Candidatus Peregrinibacteria bacterium GW2011_GWE2_39_6]|nr:MAG: polymerase III subunit delta, DNA polymerase III subunit delta protein [Candidatus Peregrinibacteria bacterium GW2011_GWE2_39_6]
MGNTPTLWNLDNEIKKLVAYAENTPITAEMIDQISSGGNITTSIFELTDALGQKNAPKCLKILHHLVDNGEELPMIFGMLIRQLRLLLQIEELHRLKQSPAQIALKLKQHPYVISTVLPQCQNFNQKELQALYKKLLSIDRSLKTGEIKYQASEINEYLLQIEKFIIETCY